MTLYVDGCAQKLRDFPFIHFVKTEAAEAEILTGLSDREAAAWKMKEWGAAEVMITHNTEVMVCDGKNIYTCPIKARNLSGRTGRGDTTFSVYITARFLSDVQAALDFSTAAVSLKL